MPRRFVHGITNTVYVAYHDSRLADDWISNFKVTPISAPYGMSGVVHSGFYDAARSSFEGLIKVLKDNVDSAFLAETEFVFTGHSLGGAMATWGCLHLHHNFDNIFPGANRLERHQIKIITFAAPKIGDSDFACSFDRCLKNDTLRFSCKADLVTCVPYRMCRSIGRQIDVYVADNAVEKIEQRTATPQNSQDAWQQFKWLHGVFGWLGNVFEEAGSEEESDEEEESDFEALKKVAKKVGAVGKEVLSLAHIVPGDDALLAAYKNFLHSLACAESPEDAEAAGRPLYWGPTNPLRRLFGI
jgi:hypothetical protein